MTRSGRAGHDAFGRKQGIAESLRDAADAEAPEPSDAFLQDDQRARRNVCAALRRNSTSSGAEPEKCCLMYTRYLTIQIGWSWGDLPKRKQDAWAALGCDAIHKAKPKALPSARLEVEVEVLRVQRARGMKQVVVRRERERLARQAALLAASPASLSWIPFKTAPLAAGARGKPHFDAPPRLRAGRFAHGHPIDLVVSYCHTPARKSGGFTWVSTLFGSELPRPFSLKRVYVYDKCCSAKAQLIDEELSMLVEMSKARGFGLQVRCLHNFGNEAYAYMVHMALHHGDFSRYIVFAHDHGPHMLARNQGHDRLCAWRYFMTLLKDTGFASFGFYNQEPSYDAMVQRISYAAAPRGGGARCRPEKLLGVAKDGSCDLVANQEVLQNGQCQHNHGGIYGGEFATTAVSLMRRSQQWFAHAASCWLDNSANSVIKGARDPDGRLPGSGIGSMLEARWHSVAGPLLLPRENFVRGGWDGMDRVCKHLRFHDTGLATNLKEAYAAAHVKSAL
jgi:hypothetical protein